MAKRASFPELHEAFAGNMSDGMWDALGRDLGLDAATFQEMEIGWAPIVEFKPKGKEPYKTFRGFWTTPERNDRGEVVGVSLRGRDGRKLMYPGSERGVAFAVYPASWAGRKQLDRAAPIAGRWKRCHEHGVKCPVCGHEKSDGCMVSSLEAPERAICVRVAEGAAKSLKLGHLHVLDERDATTAPVLPPSDRPVLVVEGMTDTAAAMQLGFVAVGRPNNTSTDYLASLLRNRDVIIVGENDRKPDGRHPGGEGAEVAATAVHEVAASVSTVFPPDHLKDLRQWVQHGATPDAILARAQPFAPADSNVLTDDRPQYIAQRIVDDLLTDKAGRRTWHFYRGAFYDWSGATYRAYGKVEGNTVLDQRITRWGANRTILNEKGDAVPLRVTDRFLSEMARHVKQATLLPEATHVPGWINGARGPDPHDLIPFTNGLFDVERRAMLAPTPDYFVASGIPRAYSPDAKCPRWMRFLYQSLDGDEESMRLLQEWFGYNLVPDARLQKFMYMYGETRAGKSLVDRVLQHMLGPDLVAAASTSFAEFGKGFDLHTLVGKLSCSFGDIRSSNNRVDTEAFSALLQITGGDAIKIKRKYQDSLALHHLYARLTLISNELLTFEDQSGAFEARALLLHFPVSFVGREDPFLFDKLKAEIDGVTCWALDGLYRLRTTGSFTNPKRSQAVMNKWRGLLNPATGFARSCLLPSEGESVSIKILLRAYRNWAMENGVTPHTFANGLIRTVEQTYPGRNIHKSKRRDDGRWVEVLRNVALTREAMAYYGT